jgi:hypothetical protein
MAEEYSVAPETASPLSWGALLAVAERCCGQPVMDRRCRPMAVFEMGAALIQMFIKSTSVAAG